MTDLKRYAAEATRLVADVVNIVDGPLTFRSDAAKLIETALRAAYQAGWDDKQRQLADSMYPRR